MSINIHIGWEYVDINFSVFCLLFLNEIKIIFKVNEEDNISMISASMADM